VKIRAPAKINFGLRVVGRRKDGYHLLDTIMLPVSLYDDIEIKKFRADEKKTARSAAHIEVTCSDPLVPGGHKNLAYRAALLLMQRCRIHARVHVHIRKRIPVGAGLGGGSSDAAATLVGLNRLFGLKLAKREIKRLALRLGADIPFFIEGRAARAQGIGERLTLLRNVPRLWFVILYPGFPILTASVYRNLSQKLTKAGVNTSITRLLMSSPDRGALLINDLEPVTVARYPIIGRLKEKLAHEGAVGVLMSGSGSSVFGVFDSKRQAEQAFRRLRREEEAQAFLVRNLG
jgi:4-diphosphocytidyl-2-C-methyl-D-erythritol kinase